MTQTTDIQSWKFEIAEIDDQHGHLFELIDELESGLNVGNGAPELADVVTRLARYVQIHFAYEEKLLLENGYPEFERHRHEHEVLAAHVRYLMRRVQLGYTPQGKEVLAFLKHWFVGHIQGSDRKYADFLKSRGAV
ncbi:MAG: hemerythrin family protein [Planctomycetes bacterium]|nr:hemerythrin family protein [Planctomycetota bacterium]